MPCNQRIWIYNFLLLAEGLLVLRKNERARIHSDKTYDVKKANLFPFNHAYENTLFGFHTKKDY